MIPQKAPKKRSSERFRELWPDIREMARPRWKVLALGFVLMLISKVCGLVLPTSSKYLIDNVIGKHQMALLGPLVLAVDGSASVTFDEFGLIAGGMAAALRDPGVIAGLTGGPAKASYCCLLLWSGTAAQDVIADWTRHNSDYRKHRHTAHRSSCNISIEPSLNDPPMRA